jgi:hypothetical protein
VGQLRVGVGYMDEVPSLLKNNIVDGKGELFHTEDEGADHLVPILEDRESGEGNIVHD